MGAGLGTVRRTESIHHVHIAQRRHATRQRLVVLLLAFVEADVLAEHGLAGSHFDAIEPVGHQRHLAPEQLGEPCRHRRQRELCRRHAFFRAPEVRQNHEARATRQCGAQRWQSGADTGIARHHAIVYRDVEVLADQHALAAQVQVRHADDLLHDYALTSRATRPAWCPACGWRSPTRCRTRSRPSPACRR